MDAKKTESSSTVTLEDIVTEIMNVPLRGAPAPSAHKRATEANKMFVNLVLSKVMEKVSEGQNVRVKGFGTFSLRLTQETAFHPSNRKRIPVLNRKRLRFTQGVKSIATLNSIGEGE